MPALRFLSPLHRATKSIHAYLGAEMDALGVSSQEGHLLSYLLSYGPCPVGDVATALDLKGPTLTGMANRLERAGLLVREVNPADRRSFLIGLTEPGTAIAEAVRKCLDTFEDRLQEATTEADRAGFHAVLNAIGRVTEGAAARSPGHADPNSESPLPEEGERP